MVQLDLNSNSQENTHVPDYIKSRVSFKDVQLKIKLRLSVGSLGEDLHRQRRVNGQCKCCGGFETLKHFLFYCPAYTKERVDLYKNLRFSCNDNDVTMFLQNPDSSICLLLGDRDDVFNAHAPNYISKAWKIRGQF